MWDLPELWWTNPCQSGYGAAYYVSPQVRPSSNVIAGPRSFTGGAISPVNEALSCLNLSSNLLEASHQL